MSICAGVCGAEIDGDGGNVRILRNGQSEHADDAEHGRHDRDDAGDNRVFNEEW
mgnify:CR=1 FL=1